MKSYLTVLLLASLNISFNFLPNSYLLITIFFLIVLDFITGVLKAIFLDIPRTSKKYRETYAKFIQYMGALLMSIGLAFLIQQMPELKDLGYFSNIVNNVILFGIIFIETTSILENLYTIDNKSLFSRFVIKPLLKITTFQIKKLTNEEKPITD